MIRKLYQYLTKKVSEKKSFTQKPWFQMGALNIEIL